VWTETRLKFLSDEPIVNGLGEAGSYDEPAWPRYVRTTDIADSRSLRSDTFASLPPEVALNAELRHGDLLMTAAGATIGKSYLHQGDEPACYAGYLVRFRARPNIDARFVAYWTESVPYWDQIRAGRVISTIENFSAGKYRSLRLSIPPYAEQRQIVAFLDAETARIDAVIEKKGAMIELLEERSFAVFSNVLIPDGSKLTRLGRFAEVQTGLTVDGSRPTGDDVVTRPYLRVANVLHGRLALDTVTEISVPRTLAERATLRSGDILMTEGGDLDKLGRGTVWRDEIRGCLHQNHVFAVRTDPGRLDADYLALLTQTAHGRAYFERTGSRITNLASTSSTKVLDFPVPVLPLERQQALVREASAATATLVEIISRLTKQIGLLREHRQALITAAVTGHLDLAKVAA